MMYSNVTRSNYKRIISFNNRKYYNNKLIINSNNKLDKPLILKNISGENSYARRYNYIKNILIQYFKNVR